MVKESICGQMEDDMKENTKMIKNMDMVFINGLMEKDMKECGLMENNMEKVKL